MGVKNLTVGALLGLATAMPAAGQDSTRTIPDIPIYSELTLEQRLGAKAGIEYEELFGMIDSKIYSDDRNFLKDMAYLQIPHMLGGFAEMAWYYATEGSVDYTSFQMLAEDIDNHGIFGITLETTVKDFNYGEPVNTVGHPLMFYSYSRFLRGRGYGPGTALLGATMMNLLHEVVLYERWERPSSGVDLYILNVAGSIFGAFSPHTGIKQGVTSDLMPYTEFYANIKGNQYFLAMEQNGHYDSLEVHERPVIPFEIIVGKYKDFGNVNVGVGVRVITDPDETKNIKTAISNYSPVPEVRLNWEP